MVGRILSNWFKHNFEDFFPSFVDLFHESLIIPEEESPFRELVVRRDHTQGEPLKDRADQL